MAAPATIENAKPCLVEPDLSFIEELSAFGAKTFKKCYQCATCSVSCSLSPDENPFPRKEMLWAKWGLKDRLAKDLDVWTCYYCGDCSAHCPRDANPGETMMALRRYLTTRYDWTGLSKRLYLSEAWELGVLLAVGLFVVALFYFFHGPMLTDRVSVNTFAPVLWVEIGDWCLALILSTFLLSNAYRMYRNIMGEEKIPLSVHIREAPTFLLNFATQKRWRDCGQDGEGEQSRRRWLLHFLLVTGYMTMMTLIIVFLRWFQTDEIHPIYHPTRLLGYYATAVLLFVTVEMMISRRKKELEIHKHSEFSDWLFLILLFLTTLTGIIMHAFRLGGMPLATYYSYVVHLAIAVPMLVIEVPFGKWSHLMYRPLALYLKALKESGAEMRA
jgi:quinone-modifying oxidoreductase subunit QmoC